jgi:hypothetical protein
MAFFFTRDFSGQPLKQVDVTHLQPPKVKAVKPDVGHHIVIVDRSGSMYGDLGSTKSILEKVFTLDEFNHPNLQFSLLSYSSEGDVKLHFAKVFVKDLMGANSPYLKEIRTMQVSGLTCISQSLKLAQSLIDKNQTTCISLHTDGYANDVSPTTEKRNIFKILGELRSNPKVTLNTVAYRDWCDFGLLTDMANQLSGACIRARDISQVYTALYSGMKAVQSESAVWEFSAPGVVSYIDKTDFVKCVAAKGHLELRGAQTLDQQGVYAFSVCDPVHKGEETATFQDKVAYLRTMLTLGDLREAKFALMALGMPEIAQKNFKALTPKDVSQFISDVDDLLFVSSVKSTSKQFGLASTSATVLEICQWLADNSGSIQINVPELVKSYRRTGLKRIAGTRLENGEVEPPPFNLVEDRDEWVALNKIDVNRTEANINLTIASKARLVNASTAEVVKEVAGIPLNLRSFRAYTVVSDGSVNLSTLPIRVSTKPAASSLSKLLGESVVPGVPVTIDLQDRAVTLPLSKGPDFSADDIRNLFQLTAESKVWGALKASTGSIQYTDEQVAALEKHCLSTALYYNAPTCNSYTDLNEAINKGQVDARVSYSFDVGLTELTSASKLKSANAILQNMFVVKLGDKVIEKPTIRDLLLEEVILTEKVKRTPPTSHDRTVMDAVSAFFNTEAPKLQAASEDDRAQLVSDKLEDLDQKIEGIWAKVKPFIFELGSTGITPEGVEVWDADALQAKYPDVSLSKAEKEGSFFEVNGVLFTMYQSKAYVSVSP